MKLCLWFQIFLLLFPVSLRAVASEPASLGTLEQLVRTWTGLRQEIAAEQRSWAEQKSVLESERILLQKEIATLTAEIQAFEEFSTAREQQNKQLTEEKEELSAFFAGLKPLLDETESFVRKQQQNLPAPLRDRVVLPKSTREVERVQNLASALRTLDELQNTFHAVREILPVAGAENREMEVLYFGLVQAFAVSSDYDWAARGVPTDAGWEWTAQPELADEIRLLLEMQAQNRAAGFLQLPLQLSGPSTERKP